jgi:hypothetical protein
MNRGTRRRAKSGNKTRSRNKNKTRGRNMRGGMFTRSKAAARRLMEPTGGKRTVGENENEGGGGGRGKSLKVEEFNPAFNPMIAAELSNTESEGEFNSNFQGVVLAPGVNPLASLRRVLSAPLKKMSASALIRSFSAPLIQNLSYLHRRTLERTESAGERRHLAGLSELDEESEPLQRFYSASASQNSEYSTELIRYDSIHQSPLRFVLYTSDAAIVARFAGKKSIQLYHNSNQSLPLTVVYLNRNALPERADIIRRLPTSVQYLSETFTRGQFNNSITLENYFLLTIEYDTNNPEGPDELPQPPTGPIFGVLCCSEETATVDSARFVDDHNVRLIPFDSLVDDPYIYVHLFTYLSDRTVGYHFFTGSHMLEGLYNLFNPIEREGVDGRIIYLEAITVPATLNFYERFGMERLNQMTLPAPITINGNPTTSVYFDPFKGFVVPDEIPYVLYQESQIRDAAGVAHTTRRARANATAQRVQAAIDPSTLRQVSPEEARQIEDAVFDFFLLRARQDRLGPRPPPPGP